MKMAILSAALLLVLLLQGCTVHLKATDVELETEAVRSNGDKNYDVVALSLLDG